MPEQWVSEIMDRMLMTYGKKFSEQWGGSDPDKLFGFWSQQLAGFTPAEIKRGLAALETRDWPPTLPEFKKLCRPAVDATAAYYEAVAGVQARERGDVGQWSHPAIFWASVQIGAFDLKSQSYTQIKARWEKALQDEMEKGQWSAIPEPMIALPAPGKTASSREKAAQMLQQLGASDALKPKSDHRAWIKKALERAKAGDDSLPGITVRFAQEAMQARAE
jgi:hypothetical protein